MNIRDSTPGFQAPRQKPGVLASPPAHSRLSPIPDHRIDDLLHWPLNVSCRNT